MRRQVQDAVTDGALAQMELDKQLDMLLGRVRELFAVDTATVLLVDSSGEQLVATATAGLAEEVIQGVRVPMGSGFAGRVAARREPIVLEHVDATTVVNPLLWQRGLRMLLGVPMVAGDETIGVLHVGSVSEREFTPTEIELLQLVADRLALAANSYRSRAERAATEVLQASLLPGHLPAVPGWELAARYVPGTDSGVGGDWYDVFPLPGQRLGLVIGDVVGNGLAAAIVMGRLRSALRAYALDYPDPADVLGKLDRKASHFEQSTMATVGYAIIDIDAHRLSLALAGHLPPVLVAPGREPSFIDAPLGPPVGRALAVHGRRSATIGLPPGALITLFTDGLVERRDIPLDDRLDELRATVRPDAPDGVCARIMSAMVGAQAATDDIALLAARHVTTTTSQPSHPQGI
jgi:serine phosphatase RsbU (regulator of sigma subunit)